MELVKISHLSLSLSLVSRADCRYGYLRGAKRRIAKTRDVVACATQLVKISHLSPTQRAPCYIVARITRRGRTGAVHAKNQVRCSGEAPGERPHTTGYQTRNR